ncbi:hypothetical protein [Janthinobacterium sp. LB3P112]|uniref:hypothetical protein n=1 Tax=Janthinobacterium sp. LB3P112 TaxID=3424196 RepID=UPI003F253E63
MLHGFRMGPQRQRYLRGQQALLAVLGREPHTPLDAAVRATLEGMGNLHKKAGKKNAPGLPAR